MKIIKSILIFIIAVFSIFLIEKNVKEIYSNYTEIKNQEEMNSTLQTQKNNIINYLENKQDEVNNLVTILNRQPTFDQISGILSGNTTNYKWIEYIDSAGVPKFTNRKVENELDKTTYVFSGELNDGARLNAAINLKEPIPEKYKDNIILTKNLENSLQLIKKNNNLIYKSDVIENTDFSIIYKKRLNLTNQTLLLLEALIIVLAILSIFFVIFKPKEKGLDTIKTFLNQVKKGNDDLRFEIIEKDPLVTLKKNLNNLLDKLENLNIKYDEFIKYRKIISDFIEKSSINKKISSFIVNITNKFNFSSVYAVLKTAEEKYFYFDNQEEKIITYNENFDKIMKNKNSTILRDFDINTLFPFLKSGINEKKDYQIFHIGNKGFFIFDKTDIIETNQNINVFDLLIQTIQNNIKIHSDKLLNLYDKIKLNKIIKNNKSGIIWVDSQGYIKLVNNYVKNLFDLDFDPEGLVIGQFFQRLGLDFSAVADSLNNQKEISEQYHIEHDSLLKEIEIKTSFINTGKNNKKEILLNISDLTEIKKENEEIVNNLNENLTTLRDEKNELLSRIEELESNLQNISQNASAGMTVKPLYNSITKNTNKSLKALKKLSFLLFDDEEKKYVKFIKNEIYHINFSIKNLSIFNEDIEINRREYNLHKLIKQSFNFYKFYLKSKNINIVTNFEESIDEIVCDKIYLGLAFNNIIYQLISTQLTTNSVEIKTKKAQDNKTEIKIQYESMKDNLKNKIVVDKNNIENQFQLLNNIIYRIIEKHNGSYSILKDEQKYVHQIII